MIKVQISQLPLSLSPRLHFCSSAMFNQIRQTLRIPLRKIQIPKKIFHHLKDFTAEEVKGLGLLCPKTSQSISMQSAAAVKAHGKKSSGPEPTPMTCLQQDGLLMPILERLSGK